MGEHTFCGIEEALEEIRAGRMLVVVDDEARENEGDLVMAAEKVTPKAVNFMAVQGRGLICMPMAGERLVQLGLGPMVPENQSTENYKTAFTVSVDARRGITTGISAFDRAATVRVLADPASGPDDLARPGHIFPLRAQDGGVLARAGHTEAAVDLARLAGLKPAGLICEIMRPDGRMARLPDLIQFATAHGLKLFTIRDLIAYRSRTERLVRRAAQTVIPTAHGEFLAYAYESLVDPKPYLALVKGEVQREGVLVRVHSSCLTGDVFHSQRCDCGDQLELAMKMIQREGRGVILYIQQEGRGIGLINKLRAYQLQDDGKDTVEANQELGFPPDLRDYGIGAQILLDLGVRSVRLLTNNPKKLVGIEGYGLRVMEQVPLLAGANHRNLRYLQTKRDKLGHQIPGELIELQGSGGAHP